MAATCGDRAHENVLLALDSTQASYIQAITTHSFLTHSLAHSLPLLRVFFVLSKHAFTHAHTQTCWLDFIFEVLSYCEPEHVGFLTLRFAGERWRVSARLFPFSLLCVICFTLFCFCYATCVRVRVRVACYCWLSSSSLSAISYWLNCVIYIWSCCRRHRRSAHSRGRVCAQHIA